MDLASVNGLLRAGKGTSVPPRATRNHVGKDGMHAAKISGLGGVLVALLAACGGGDGAAARKEAAGPPVNGGTAVVAVKSDFDAFNPVTNSALTTDDVIKFMLFTPLVQFDEKLNPVPYLAERWELSDTSVTFHLRDGVRWHDGQPVTAEDVKFTFDLAKDPQTASQLGAVYLGLVRSATVVDPRTIRFGFVSPHAQPLDDFWWAPVPKHLLQGVPRAQMSQAPFNRQPVGSGPFKLVSWKAGESLTLEANPQFPQALGGRPRLDRVVFRIIPESQTRLQELVTGTSDVDYTVLPDEAQQLQRQAGIELFHYPSREFTYLGWNNEREPFRDPRVRRALGMATNRQQMVQALLLGYGKLSGSVIPPISPVAPDVPALPYDTAQAKQLLAQAGWTDTNRDGLLDKGGRPLRFTLITNSSNKLFTEMATVVQSQLKQVGVGVEIRTVEFQTMLRQHKGRDYEAIITNWTWDYFKADPSPLFSCEQARKPQSANRTGYCNLRADSLLARGLRTTDPAQARALWAEYSRIIQEDQPLTILFWTEEIAAAGPRIQGVRMDARSKLVNVGQWWIPAAAQRR